MQKHEKDTGTQHNSAAGHMEHCFAVFKKYCIAAWPSLAGLSARSAEVNLLTEYARHLHFAIMFETARVSKTKRMQGTQIVNSIGLSCAQNRTGWKLACLNN